MRQRRIPEFVVLQVFNEPDGVELNESGAWPDREIRWPVYDAQRVEIVVDLTDDTIVSARIATPSLGPCLRVAQVQ